MPARGLWRSPASWSSYTSLSFFFSSRRRHTRSLCDWSSDVCSSDLGRDQTKWCVGITVDPQGGKIYWTQKGTEKGGVGRIFRANIEIPVGQTATNRTDIEVFFDGLPEPIDLELDPEKRVLYWTDRGDPPRGNTVNRASIDAKPPAPEILVTHLMEGIGIALDLKGNRMFITDLAGSVYSARLDGSEKKPVQIGRAHV